MKFGGQVRCVTRTNRFDFGEDPDPDPATRIFKRFFTIERRGQKRYIARYLKRLWTDSDETWWAGWVCDEDELIRFCWRSGFGSEYDNFLIYKMILHHWEIGPKTINLLYSTISKKFIVPRYVLLDEALRGEGTRSTECLSSSDCYYVIFIVFICYVMIISCFYLVNYL